MNQWNDQVNQTPLINRGNTWVEQQGYDRQPRFISSIQNSEMNGQYLRYFYKKMF